MRLGPGGEGTRNRSEVRAGCWHEGGHQDDPAPGLRRPGLRCVARGSSMASSSRAVPPPHPTLTPAALSRAGRWGPSVGDRRTRMAAPKPLPVTKNLKLLLRMLNVTRGPWLQDMPGGRAGGRAADRHKGG